MTNKEANAELRSLESESKNVAPTRATESELKNSKNLSTEAKIAAEETPSKFKVWLQKKGILQWTYKWTIGNKWFWILGGGGLAAYWFWDDWFKNNDVAVKNVDPVPDNVDLEGGAGPGFEDSSNEQQQIDDFINDPNATDGGPNDPYLLSGKKYRICKKGPFKLGCMTTTRGDDGDLVGNLQASLNLKATGKWGYKTNAELMDREGVDELSLTNMQNR